MTASVLHHVSIWFIANELSLNIDRTCNYINFQDDPFQSMYKDEK
jgi:hypothetical protein